MGAGYVRAKPITRRSNRGLLPLGRRWLPLLTATLVATLSSRCSPPSRTTVLVTPTASTDARTDGLVLDSDGGGVKVDASGDAPAQEVHRICPATTCQDTVSILVTLAERPQTLADAEIILAIGAETLDLKPPHTLTDSPHDRSVPWGPSYRLTTRVHPVSPSLSQFLIALIIPKELAVPGLQYSVKIAAADGRRLLDVSRTLNPGPSPNNIPACGIVCSGFGERLYSTSRSGVTCGSADCESGLELTLHAPAVLSRITDSDTVEVCRNGACGTASLRGIEEVRWYQAHRSEYLNYAFGFRVGPYRVAGRYDAHTPEEIHFSALWEPAGLANGDKYRVTFYKGRQILGRFERALRYEESYPNGRECDAVPCRRAVVKGQM